MDINDFWLLIAESNALTTSSDARGELLTDLLSGYSDNDIIDFQCCVDKLCHRANTYDLRGAALYIMYRNSEEAIRGFQLWLIGQGRDAFNAAVDSAESLSELPSLRQLAGKRSWSNDMHPIWEDLDYISRDAYLRKGGNDEAYDQIIEMRVPQIFRDRTPHGEPWDYFDRDLQAERFPRIGYHVRGVRN